MNERVAQQFVSTLVLTKQAIVKVSAVLDKLEQSEDRSPETLLALSRLLCTLGTFIADNP